MAEDTQKLVEYGENRLVQQLSISSGALQASVENMIEMKDRKDLRETMFLNTLSSYQTHRLLAREWGINPQKYKEYDERVAKSLQELAESINDWNHIPISVEGFEERNKQSKFIQLSA